MLEIVPTKSFKKDVKKYQHKKDIIEELYDVTYQRYLKSSIPQRKIIA